MDKNGNELNYNEEDELLKCDLCCVKASLGGNVPGLFKYVRENQESSQPQTRAFGHLKSHIKEHFIKKPHLRMKEKSLKEDAKKLE